MQIIHQGKSGRKYFLVVRPIPDPKKIKPGDTVLLRHPRTQQERTVKVSDKYWFNLKWWDIPESFVMLNFGMSSIDLKNYLETTHLEFRGIEQVKFLMVEEIM